MMNQPIKRRAYLLQKSMVTTAKPQQNYPFDEWVRLFLLDLRAGNLAVRTLEFHEGNLNAFRKAFEAIVFISSSNSSFDSAS
jgi:hypothetical protein